VSLLPLHRRLRGALLEEQSASDQRQRDATVKTAAIVIMRLRQRLLKVSLMA